MPGALRAAEGPYRSWFATPFGEVWLRRLEPSFIPAEVVHPETRDTLTGIGFPPPRRV
ncbi:hypothetical protein RKD41_005282 [Streptomyces tendae]